MSKQVNTRVPDELYGRLESMAETLGLTVSALVRVAVVEYLNNHERGLSMREMLVAWVVNGMDVRYVPARPGQEPGMNDKGAVVRITGIPEGVTQNEVIKAFANTITWIPDGPFEIPWDMLGLKDDGTPKWVTAEKLRK